MDSKTTSDIVSNASEFVTLAKAAVFGASGLGVVGWGIKKAWASYFAHHTDVSKHIDGRETSLDKKEEMIFGQVSKQGELVFQLLADMTAKSGEQSVAIRENSQAIAKITEMIVVHSDLLQKHTEYVNKLSEQIGLKNEDLLNKINSGLENSFANYVHFLNKHPEVARKILSERNNVIDTVLSEVERSTELPILAPTKED